MGLFTLSRNALHQRRAFERAHKVFTAGGNLREGCVVYISRVLGRTVFKLQGGWDCAGGLTGV